MTVTPEQLASRGAALRRLLAAHDLAAVVLVPGTNLDYFTGLHLHLGSRPFMGIVTADGFSAIIPYLELPQLDLIPAMHTRPFAWTDADGYAGAFRAAVTELGLTGRRIGVDGMTMRFTEGAAWLAADPTLTLVPCERELIGIRAIKAADEIAAMRAAIAVSEAALADLLPTIQPGQTEAAIADRLNALQAQHGAQYGKLVPAFDLLVQSGPNSSNPHGAATDRVVQPGEFLLIDYGCKVHGYPSDITRTFVVGGEPTDEMRQIYETVQAANAAARAIAAPGVAMGDVDKAARAVIEAAGYGDYFTHRTGHGLGMDTHEAIPQIAANVTDVLQPGMTFTIEPGIYLPGVGGVRIEDDMLVTATGCESLTQFPRELRVIG